MKTNFDLVKNRSVVMDGDDGMIMPYKIFPTVKDFVDFLNLPVEEKILDEDEKRYLKNIIRPFRNSVTDIHKIRYDEEYEYLYFKNGKPKKKYMYCLNEGKNKMNASRISSTINAAETAFASMISGDSVADLLETLSDLQLLQQALFAAVDNIAALDMEDKRREAENKRAF